MLWAVFIIPISLIEALPISKNANEDIHQGRQLNEYLPLWITLNDDGLLNIVNTFTKNPSIDIPSMVIEYTASIYDDVVSDDEFLNAAILTATRLQSEFDIPAELNIIEGIESKLKFDDSPMNQFDDNLGKVQTRGVMNQLYSISETNPSHEALSNALGDVRHDLIKKSILDISREDLLDRWDNIKSILEEDDDDEDVDSEASSEDDSGNSEDNVDNGAIDIPPLLPTPNIPIYSNISGTSLQLTRTLEPPIVSKHFVHTDSKDENQRSKEINKRKAYGSGLNNVSFKKSDTSDKISQKPFKSENAYRSKAFLPINERHVRLPSSHFSVYDSPSEYSDSVVLALSSDYQSSIERQQPVKNVRSNILNFELPLNIVGPHQTFLTF